MRRGICVILALLIVMWGVGGCQKPDPVTPDDDTEQTDKPGGDEGGEDNPGDEDDPGTGGEDNPGDEPGDEDDPGDEEPGGDEPGDEPAYEILDPGEQYTETPVYPSHPDLVRDVECTEFYDNLYDWIEPDFGNVDYVLSQGGGTAWPILTDDLHIRMYQASGSKGGNYIRIRAKYDARLLNVTVGSATDTKIAWTLDGKMKKSSTVSLAAGERCTVGEDVLGDGVGEVCFYCMGADQKERWELDYIKVTYRGGYTEDDFYVDPVECGPLVKVKFPFTENFEDAAFPTTEKNTYDKYGLTAGPANFQWSTWYGCFSWQYPKALKGKLGEKSPQLRVYQEDEDYDKTQYGHLKMEYFLSGLSSVSFKYYFSEFWVSATISYCEFGSSEWTAPQQIALQNYSDRQTLREFKYVLDGGVPHDAKIKIEIDESTGHPSSDHYDLIFDDFVFE